MDAATMPAMSAAAIRRFDLAQLTIGVCLFALLTSAFGVGPDSPIASCAFLVAICFVASPTWLLGFWTRRTGYPLISKREWMATRQRALKPFPVALIRGLLTGLLLVQYSLWEPVWSLGGRGWLTVAAIGLFFVFCFALTGLLARWLPG